MQRSHMEAVMKWSFAALTALVLLAPGMTAAAEDYDTRPQVCGEGSGFRRTTQHRLFGCLPFCCQDQCDNVCDCDTPCCEYCGKKRPARKPKRPCFLSCLGAEEVPRGQVGMAIAARVNGLGRSLGAEAGSEDEASGSSAEAGSENEGELSRMDKLESDMTRLALVVEELARSQRQQQQDLTRATLLLEQMAR